MSLLVTQQAPDFCADAYFKGEFKQVRLSDYRGKKVVLFFYPLDFTFVCPTEITAFSDAIAEFEARNTQILGVSVDSKHTHRAWAETERRDGGIKGVNFPLISDLTREICRSYNVLLDAGHSLRGLFIINQDGIIKHMTVNHNDLGRNIHEVLRLLDALDHTEKYGEVCPANWQKGDVAMKADIKSLKEYQARHDLAGVR